MSITLAAWLAIKLNRGYRESPGGLLTISLWSRFPGTPIDESDAKIVWTSDELQDPLSNILFSMDSDGFAEDAGYRIGSAAWSSRYPLPSTIGPFPKRQWIRRLQFIKKQASLNQSDLANDLSIPPAKLQKDGYVIYPEGVNAGNGPLGACSWEITGCLRDLENGYHNDFDIIDTDNRTWAVNFDDGPLPPSESLYKTLDQFNVRATHFWIGGNVLKYWKLALMANERGDHLAVHTWSHSHLTSLTDLQILGELGWTIQIISDLTGKVPKFFRPPYGNIDNRIRAIAKHVFGLETVIWNHDSVDWGLNQTYATGDQVDEPDPNNTPTLTQVISNIENLARDGVPGRESFAGCLILEHELSEEAVRAFKQSWDVVQKQNFTRVGPLPDCLLNGTTDWYQRP